MNLTSLITLPARLGYEAARRTIDLALGAGRLVGLVPNEAPPGKAPSPPTRRPRPPKRGMDDTTLTRKVETEIFRIRGVAKGRIDVNAADGVVWLRGVAKTPAQIRQLEAKAAAIPEVRRVEVLLHLPKTPAPTRTDTPARQRRTRSTSPRTGGARTRSPRTARAAARREGAARGGGAAAKRTAAPAGLAGVDQSDDAALTRKVESEIFREGYAPKGSVNVDFADGVVRLRGRARTADDVRELQRRAISVPGVKRVENLLELADAPPTAHTAVPPDSEERSGSDEPLPTEAADRGEARQPAPLGAGDDAPGGGGGGDARTLIP
jgi:osmotically-inducible protein OsmY